jgi:hypothetical protein
VSSLSTQVRGYLLTGYAALRVEWCKARARAERWHEEVILLDEEMRRSVEYFRWRSQVWTARSASTVGTNAETNAGLNAYGLQQAWMFSTMAKVFVGSWREVRRKARCFVDSGEFLGDEEPLDSSVRVAEADEDDVLGAEDVGWEVDAWAVDDADDV